jgi:methyl-accepting chemotaxis protein
MKLLETKNNFSILDTDINVTVEKIKEINAMVDDLDKLRKGLVDIIGSLSAVSQQNAASAEETNASVEELLSTIEQMCNDIKSVKDETDVLLDSITVFNIEDTTKN